MKDITQNIISYLVNDATLAGLMNTTTPIKNLYTGPVDVVKEKQNELGFPLLTLIAVSESFRTVPQGCRDSRVQLDIWSRNSEAEVQNIYEQVESILNYINPFFNDTHTRIFWQRSGGMHAQYESDVRLWHWSCDFVVWSNTV